MNKLWVGEVRGSPAQGKKAGVLILFHKQLGATVERKIHDTEGRLIMLTIAIVQQKLTLTNIYTTNNQRKKTYQDIMGWLGGATMTVHLMGGDFNNVMDVEEY